MPLAAINTVAGLMGIDLETFRPSPNVDGRGAYGGYSGRGVKPIALRAVSSVAAAMGLPVSGSGGIADWEDAAEFLLAGAGTFQVCTEVMLHGYGLIDPLREGLARYLEYKGFDTLATGGGCGTPLPGRLRLARQHRRPFAPRSTPTAATPAVGACRRARTAAFRPSP